jgi:hypothetical protein
MIYLHAGEYEFLPEAPSVPLELVRYPRFSHLDLAVLIRAMF